MQRLELLACSLDFIERHMNETVRTEDIAAACYCSKSTIPQSGEIHGDLSEICKSVTGSPAGSFPERRYLFYAEKRYQPAL